MSRVIQEFVPVIHTPVVMIFWHHENFHIRNANGTLLTGIEGIVRPLAVLMT